jgi:hypothetical protein
MPFLTCPLLDADGTLSAVHTLTATGITGVLQVSPTTYLLMSIWLLTLEELVLSEDTPITTVCPPPALLLYRLSPTCVLEHGQQESFVQACPKKHLGKSVFLAVVL